MIAKGVGGTLVDVVASSSVALPPELANAFKTAGKIDTVSVTVTVVKFKVTFVHICTSIVFILLIS